VHTHTGQQSFNKGPDFCQARDSARCRARFGASPGPCKLMNYRDLIKEIVNTYQQHGWELRRVLLRPETSAELRVEFAPDSFSLAGVRIEEALVDGLWFSRPSHEQREAWELRLLTENPFALFETFEKDETEEQREEMRREMEARLRDYANK
jgi:hypothetical protein